MATKKPFEIPLQPAGEPRCRGPYYVDQKIDITFRVCFSPGDRAENADISCTMLGSDQLNFGLSGTKRCERVHEFILADG